MVGAYRGKRLFDLLAVGLSLPVWGTVVLALATMVLARVGRPVFFRQVRPGLSGRPFELLKFRTMTDARDAAGHPLPDADRLTPFGQWLRSTSLDELPELLNILRGEMSLVGPRPLLMRYLPRYSAHHRRRHDVRPGLTGLAQVSGRNGLPWPVRLDLDVDYVDRCSLALDVSILLRTVKAVVSRSGISAAGEATMTEFTGYREG